MKNWKLRTAEIAKELNDELTDGFADAFVEFATGAKSAGDAFSDFARNTLKWIVQILAKQAAMNISSGVSGFIGQMFAPKAHEGGIAGKGKLVYQSVPRYHTGGIAGNEVPAVLKKGEGVFTPEQMEAHQNLLMSKMGEVEQSQKPKPQFSRQGQVSLNAPDPKDGQEMTLVTHDK